MARRASARRAMTLFELIAVVVHHRHRQPDGGDALLDDDARRYRRTGLPAACRSIPAGPPTCDCHRRQSPASLHARRRQRDAVRRLQPGRRARYTLVDDVHAVPANVTVTTGGVTDVEFQFTGEALASYTISITAPDRLDTVTVPQVTGKAFVQ